MSYTPKNINGQATMANSEPVVIASNQSAIPITDNSGSITVDGTVGISAGTSNIGDVDVLTVPSDPFGTNADAPSTSGSISGKLRQIATNGIPITSIEPGFSGTSLGKQEDVAHNSGDVGVLALGVRRDTAASGAGTDGDNATLNLDNTGHLWVRVGATDTLTPGTGATNLGKAEDAAHASGDTGVGFWGVRNDSLGTTFTSTNGDYSPVGVNSAGAVFVANPTAANLNVVAYGYDGSGNPALSVESGGILKTSGSIAHDAADANNPVKVGGQARTTNPTAVADADRANFITDKVGKQIAVSAIRELKGIQTTTISSSTTETTIVTAVASTFCDIYRLVIANTSASACKVTIKDSTAGTTRYVFNVPAGDTRGFSGDAGSAVIQATVNNNWTATCGTSVADIVITAEYVRNI